MQFMIQSDHITQLFESSSLHTRELQSSFLSCMSLNNVSRSFTAWMTNLSALELQYPEEKKEIWAGVAWSYLSAERFEKLQLPKSLHQHSVQDP